MSTQIHKQYWKALEERNGAVPEDLHPHHPHEEKEIPVGRRDFLKLAGFTVGGTLLAGCQRAPVEKAIPFLIQPEEIHPGRSFYYASTCGACSAACGILIKNRDGRPIKLEGNPEHPLSRGGLCAVGQAAVLELYDSLRLKKPKISGKDVSWVEVDEAIKLRLDQLRRTGGRLRLLTGTLHGRTAAVVIEKFLGTFPNAQHIVYDPLSSSAISQAYEQTHGQRLVPRFHLDRALTIASFDADFLGTWISPLEFTGSWRAARRPDAEHPLVPYHAQFESRMSVTGSKADDRFPAAPAEIRYLLRELTSLLAAKANVPIPDRLKQQGVPASLSHVSLNKVADRLWETRGHSLIVAGLQDVESQLLCNFANHLLGSYGTTIDLEHPSRQKQGNDRALAGLVSELREGAVDALLIAGVNPAYELPLEPELLRGVPLLVSFSPYWDETSQLAHFVCPDHHFLESWGDTEPVHGIVSLMQPALEPLFETRSLLESLSAWAGELKSAYEIIQENWRLNLFPLSGAKTFESFWDQTLHDGYAKLQRPSVGAENFRTAALEAVRSEPLVPGHALALVLYPKVAITDGRHAHNPWLQELPDPISKVTWDNYACLSPQLARDLKVEEGETVLIRKGNRSLELPVNIQPGQHRGVVSVALGYGGMMTERFAHIGPKWLEALPSIGRNGRVGQNVSEWLGLTADGLSYELDEIKIEKTGRKHPIASTQTHHYLTVPKHLAPRGGERRPIIQETTLAALTEGAHEETAHHEKHPELWSEDHIYPEHHWGLVIDLDACTGCSACVIACQSENNIPVVGKDEVRRQREMHWLRIDRYYYEEGARVDVAYQPMMCQQCGHAPCETVCPVLATVHSSEGLNQQVYNRCVGTRYCANNCPYKVRRFNWFDYAHEDRLQNLSLNPDVAVRSRGIMEKCTFCVQRIQEAKIEARRQNRPLLDGEIQPACQQSCPAQAIVFGDMKDPKSRISQLIKTRRHYRVLEETNVRPSVGYLSIVRNRGEHHEETEGKSHA